MKILCTLVFVKLSEGSVFGRLTAPADSYARIELECEKFIGNWLYLYKIESFSK